MLPGLQTSGQLCAMFLWVVVPLDGVGPRSKGFLLGGVVTKRLPPFVQPDMGKLKATIYVLTRKTKSRDNWLGLLASAQFNSR